MIPPSCNSLGDYLVLIEAEMPAFDGLPRSIRRALADAWFDWAVSPIESAYRARHPGFKNTGAVVRKIGESDRNYSRETGPRLPRRRARA